MIIIVKAYKEKNRPYVMLSSGSNRLAYVLIVIIALLSVIMITNVLMYADMCSDYNPFLSSAFLGVSNVYAWY